MEFQKNDIKFIKNKVLLQKAESFEPELTDTTITPDSIVTVEKDSSIYGYGTRKNQKYYGTIQSNSGQK